MRDAIRGRFANRFFADKEVPEAVLHDILELAATAPSGANIQPWRVYVVTGGAKNALSGAIHAALREEPHRHVSEYSYYTDPLPEPYLQRRREFGAVFYGGLGIAQADLAARQRQTAKNYDFFGAPVGMIFTIDRRLEKGSWLDLGMFIQTVMLAARVHALETCPQETFSRFHRVIRQHLPLDDVETVVCGMSLGYADEAANAGRGVQGRRGPADFAVFADAADTLHDPDPGQSPAGQNNSNEE
tara:strand:+ start:265 stop:996 length:732 start_codon:yes stop_codon:yes gene_type:complete